ncbi:MAG TPA: RNA polymerase sigma factor [Polyangia bacterium]
MNRYAEGDDSAFSLLYDLLVPRLESFLLRLTPDRARVEDVVQQTMLQVHRQRGRFIRGSEVRPWAFAIARRCLIDSIRADKRHRSALESFSAQAPPPAASIEDMVSSMETTSLFVDQLRRLPDNQRIAIELIKQEGLSLREAALILGTTINAMKLRVRRACMALQGTTLEHCVR